MQVFLDNTVDLVHLDAEAELGNGGSVSVVDYFSRNHLRWDLSLLPGWLWCPNSLPQVGRGT